MELKNALMHQQTINILTDNVPFVNTDGCFELNLPTLNTFYCHQLKLKLNDNSELFVTTFIFT